MEDARAIRTTDPRDALRIVRQAGLPFALLVLLGVAVFSYTQVRQFREDLDWRAHTHLVLEHIERTQTALLAAESLRRSYRLSRDKADLALIGERVDDGTRELDVVYELTRDNPSQTARIDALRPLIKERTAILYDGIDLPSWELLDAATRDEQRLRQLHGAEVEKNIRVKIDILRSVEQRLLVERDARTAASASATEKTIFYGSPIGMGLVILFYASLVSENRARLRSQLALREANAILRGVLEGAHDVIGVKDRDGRYVLINEAGCKAFERSESEILGKTVGELLSKDTGRSIMEMDAEIVRSGKSILAEQATLVGDRARVYSTAKAPYRDADGNVIGVISISRDITERKRLEEQVAKQNVERGELIEKLERQSLELTRASEMLREQAVRDPLTGLFNRRYLDETLTRELARASRSEHVLSVIMLDLDHFKRLNDTHGHATGDEVLRRFGSVLAKKVRRDDIACRYGGEEFAVIMPNLSLAQALERAEELRRAAEQLMSADGENAIETSASLGVACFPAHGDTGATLLQAADVALYLSKSGGRNRVTAATG